MTGPHVTNTQLLSLVTAQWSVDLCVLLTPYNLIYFGHIIFNYPVRAFHHRDVYVL